MRTAIFFILLFSGQLIFSQTVIKLTHKSGPRHEYHFVHPTDTAFVFTGRDEDMGQWTNPYYELKTSIADGEYLIYINKMLSLTAFIKNRLPDSTWTYYSQNGKLYRTVSYKEGKLSGDEIYYNNNGSIWAVNKYLDGNYEGSTSYYESGNIMQKSTRKGDETIVEDFPDRIKTTD